MASSPFPEHFRGVITDVKPDRDRSITIVRKEIEVDPKARDDQKAPCSTCGVKSKWIREGILILDSLGWLYLVGPDCAQDHYGELFKIEETRFNHQEAERRAEAYLLTKLVHLPELITYAKAMQAAANRTITPRDRLHYSAKAIAAFRQAATKQDGWLRVDLGHDFVRIARLRGMAVLNRKNTAPDLAKSAVVELQRYGNTEDSAFATMVRAESAGDLAVLASRMRDALKALKDLRDILADYQKFFSVENYNGIKEWAMHGNCPLPMTVEIRDDKRTIEIDGARKRLPIDVVPIMEDLPPVPIGMSGD